MRQVLEHICSRPEAIVNCFHLRYLRTFLILSSLHLFLQPPAFDRISFVGAVGQLLYDLTTAKSSTLRLSLHSVLGSFFLHIQQDAVPKLYKDGYGKSCLDWTESLFLNV